MKNFEAPEIEVKVFVVENIITESSREDEGPMVG